MEIRGFRMRQLSFGCAGKWSPNAAAVQQAAMLLKNGSNPVGVEYKQQPGAAPLYRIVNNQDYHQAAQNGTLTFTAWA